MANRTTLVDNNTWNNTHIASVGKAMSSGEEEAYEVLQKHDVDYILVIFGGLIGYGGDDINKFLWMVRISQGVYPKDIVESHYLTPRGEYRVDSAHVTPTMKKSIMFKMSYYRFNELYGNSQKGQDRVRGVEVDCGDIQLSTLEEAYTSEHWIVRIFEVKKPDNLGRNLIHSSAFDRGTRRGRQLLRRHQ